VIDSINEIGFKATWVPDKNEKTFYFSIKGLASSRDATDITNRLSESKAIIKNCEVNYSTNTCTVTTYIPDNKVKIDSMVKQLKSEIESAVKEHKLKQT